ncbi:SANT/Myb domain [Dillenia turbinata]|uniref:SANT/Myb domain n=1 Tax=Dillenia turbinata TaxID=194707 RepID=A0AAN8Z164_9MAGN
MSKEMAQSSNARRDIWTKDEEEILMIAHFAYDNCWVNIAEHLPRRTDNDIRNHWNTMQ